MCVALVAAACGSSSTGTTTTATTAPPASSSTTTTIAQDLNPNLPGITKSTIKIGVWWVDSTGGCASLGVSSPTANCGSSDEHEITAMGKYINAHGGIAGRHVDVVIYHTTFTGLPFAESYQQACTYFTQDNPVYAVLSQNGIFGESNECFAEHHIITLNPQTYPYDSVDYAKYSPYLYSPDHPRANRWVQAYIDGLYNGGFFSGSGVKVGLVRYNFPETTLVTNSVLVPALTAHHLSLTEDAVLTPPASADALGALQTAITTTVLKFKAAGVNRVIFFTDEGSVDLYWYSVAKSQNYYPRYGLSSNQDIAVFISLAPKGSFKGAMGVGWDPFYDVQVAQDPGATAATELCKSIMNAPKDVPAGRTNYCDSFLFLQTAFAKAVKLGNITPLGFRNAVNTLGTSFKPTEVFSDNFGPGLYDGPSSYRLYHYVEACNCFEYYGPLHPMPDSPVPGLG